MLMHHKKEVYTWIEQRVNLRTGEETEEEEQEQEQEKAGV
jgi:histone deacetylase 6